MSTETLREKWEALKVEQPHLRIRNAAEMLNVSEAELLATKIGETVIRLQPSFKEILSEVESLGKVMGLTRNEECVHERKGVYANADFSNPHAGLFVNPDIDQRIFCRIGLKLMRYQKHLNTVIELLCNSSVKMGMLFIKYI